MGRFGFSLLIFAFLFFCINLNIEARSIASNLKRPPPPRWPNMTEIGLSEPAPKAADAAEVYPASDSKAAGIVKIEPVREPMEPGTEEAETDTESMSSHTKAHAEPAQENLASEPK